MKKIGKCEVCGGKIIQAGNGNIFCEDCADKGFGEKLQAWADWKENLLKDEQLTIPAVAFIELFDKAACIQHWHNTGKNDEGMVVSSESVYELWEVLEKYRDLRHSL